MKGKEDGPAEKGYTRSPMFPDGEDWGRTIPGTNPGTGNGGWDPYDTVRENHNRRIYDNDRQENTR